MQGVTTAAQHNLILIISDPAENHSIILYLLAQQIIIGSNGRSPANPPRIAMKHKNGLHDFHTLAIIHTNMQQDNEGRKAPVFLVGGVPIYGDAILAPMAGYSDVPYRALCRAYGSAMNYTEFVPVEGLLGKKRDNRFWQRLDKKPDEHPVVFQIFGNDAQKILDAALRIEELEPDIIDINMGCATRRVSGRGAGVGMMPQPQLVRETFNLLTQHLRVPVSGKIRLGGMPIIATMLRLHGLCRTMARR